MRANGTEATASTIVAVKFTGSKKPLEFGIDLLKNVPPKQSMRVNTKSLGTVQCIHKCNHDGYRPSWDRLGGAMVPPTQFYFHSTVHNGTCGVIPLP